MSASKLPTQRELRVGEEIRHALAQILAKGSFRDPALQDVSITVSEVRPRPDLKTAKAFVYPLGGGPTREVVDGLNRASAFIRGRLGKMIHLKSTPKITFLADQSFDTASRVTEMLRDEHIAQDLKQDDGA